MVVDVDDDDDDDDVMKPNIQHWEVDCVWLL